MAKKNETAKKNEIEEPSVELNPIKEQAEIVLQSVENTLVELEIFFVKLRDAHESVSRVVDAKERMNRTKKELMPYLN